MEISSFTGILNSDKTKEKAKTVAAPALLASGAAFLASKAPQGAADTVKLSTRLSKAGKAGLITAGVMALLTVNKEEISNLKDKFSGLLKRNKTEAPVNEGEAPAIIPEAPLTQDAVAGTPEITAETPEIAPEIAAEAPEIQTAQPDIQAQTDIQAQPDVQAQVDAQNIQAQANESQELPLPANNPFAICGTTQG